MTAALVRASLRARWRALPPPLRAMAVVATVVLLLFAAPLPWLGRSGADTATQVAALARPGDLRMLSSLTCPVCVQARRWFEAHRVPFEECFVERDARCREEFERLRAPGTPVIVVAGRPLLGFVPERLLAALQAGRPAGGG